MVQIIPLVCVLTGSPMKIKFKIAVSLFIITLLTNTVVIAEEEDSFMLDDEPETSPEEKNDSNYIEIGGLYSDTNSSKLGEYSGLTDRQGYVIGSLNIQQRDAYDSETAQFWWLTGDNLGLDSRSIQAEYGQQGSYKLFFEYDQLPHHTLVKAKSPFNNIGSDNLRLPDDWVPGITTEQMTQLNDRLKNIEFGTERKKYNGGFSVDLTDNWNIKLVLQHEDKEGLEAKGAVMGISGFNPLSIVVPKPVDQESNDLDMTIAFNGEKSQVQLRYHLSLFDNHYASLNWDNPYQLRLPSESGFLDNVGGLSVAPDNQAHKISLSAAYRLAAKTRLSGSFSYGLMSQDSSYIGYTVNPLLTVNTPLPRQSADAEVETLHANLVFTTVPMKNMDIRSSYVFDQRDNNTPRADYAVLRNDSENQITQSNSQTIRNNLPYGRQQHRFKIDAGYRLLPQTKLSIGYGFERNERDYSQVEHTDEHNSHIKLTSHPLNTLNSWIKYEYIIRNSSEYNGDVLFLESHAQRFLATLPEQLRFENDPLIRPSNLADRKRNKVSFSINWLPLDALSIGFSGSYSNNNYIKTKIGLTASDSFNGTLDINYTLNEALSLYSFYSYEHFQNQQDGYSRFSNAELLLTRDPDKYWQVDTEDKIHTVGLGIDWQMIENTLDFQLDYTFSKAATETDTEQQNSLDSSPLPDLKTTLHSVNLRANYLLMENTRLQLSYRYEFFKTTDFALDNIAPDSINEVLGLGNVSPDYNAHVIGISIFYEF